MYPLRAGGTSASATRPRENLGTALATDTDQLLLRGQRHHGGPPLKPADRRFVDTSNLTIGDTDSSLSHTGPDEPQSLSVTGTPGRRAPYRAYRPVRHREHDHQGAGIVEPNGGSPGRQGWGDDPWRVQLTAVWFMTRSQLRRPLAPWRRIICGGPAVQLHQAALGTAAPADRRSFPASRRRYDSGVPSGTRQVKRRNHTVNGSYLTRFADDRGLLAGIELPGRRWTGTTPAPATRPTPSSAKPSSPPVTSSPATANCSSGSTRSPAPRRTQALAALCGQLNQAASHYPAPISSWASSPRQSLEGRMRI
jgi:hypothetical protein